MKSNKIHYTSPDKENGKSVKYRQGDCLTIRYKNGKYLGVLISEKFNKYYDCTLLEYYHDVRPVFDDFINGKVFGTHFGSWDKLTFTVDKRMITCKYIDECNDVERVGSVKLINSLQKASYSYVSDKDQLLAYYLEEIPLRNEKTKNAEKFPDLAFVSKHLINMRNIIIA